MEIIRSFAGNDIAGEEVKAILARPSRRPQRAAAIPETIDQALRMRLEAWALRAKRRCHEGLFVPEIITAQIVAKPLDPRMAQIMLAPVAVMDQVRDEMAMRWHAGTE